MSRTVPEKSSDVRTVLCYVGSTCPVSLVEIQSNMPCSMPEAVHEVSPGDQSWTGACSACLQVSDLRSGCMSIPAVTGAGTRSSSTDLEAAEPSPDEVLPHSKVQQPANASAAASRFRASTSAPRKSAPLANLCRLCPFAGPAFSPLLTFRDEASHLCPRFLSCITTLFRLSFCKCVDFFLLVRHSFCAIRRFASFQNLLQKTLRNHPSSRVGRVKAIGSS